MGGENKRQVLNKCEKWQKTKLRCSKSFDDVKTNKLKIYTKESKITNIEKYKSTRPIYKKLKDLNCSVIVKEINQELKFPPKSKHLIQMLFQEILANIFQGPIILILT